MALVNLINVRIAYREKMTPGSGNSSLRPFEKAVIRYWLFHRKLFVSADVRRDF